MTWRRVELQRKVRRRPEAEGSYSWQNFINGRIKSPSIEASPEAVDGACAKVAVPVEAFQGVVLAGVFKHASRDIWVEVAVRDYDKMLAPGESVIWIARVILAAGYRLLLRWYGFEQPGDEVHDFWVNGLSADVHRIGFAATAKGYSACPPKVLLDRIEDVDAFSASFYAKNVKMRTFADYFEEQRTTLSFNKFQVGDRLELLDGLRSTRVRPAIVTATAGSRVCVTISTNEWKPAPDDDLDESDRQFEVDFWVDQNSFYLFHVGWASLNGYGLAARNSYKQHADQIAKALASGTPPPWKPNDVVPEKVRVWQPKVEEPISAESSETGWEAGMKLEAFDPLSASFAELKVATVIEVLKDGYLRIGFDGPGMEDECIPLHSTSRLLFPVGYATRHGIKLTPPQDMEGDFSWDAYLRQCPAKAAPESLFAAEPNRSDLEKFAIGAHLEASDMCEPTLVCPATVVSRHGRLLLIHFDGWEDSYDQLFDVESDDIFPLGWCEAHSYKLEPPKSEEPLSKKKRKQ